MLAVVVAGTIALGSLAVAFGASTSADRVADNARALHSTNATLGAAALARASVAQAVIFAVDAELGVADEAAVADATDEAEASLAAAVQWAGSLDDTAAQGEVTTFAAGGAEVLALIAADQASAAADLSEAGFEAAYDAVDARLSQRLALIAEEIDASQIGADRLRQAIQFMGTLVIPVAAILGYRALARRQVRESRRRMQAQIETQQGLNQAKDELIASVSHEFRTPLTSIYGFSELLVEDGFDDVEQAAELVRIINTQSTELSRMVEDVLTAARLDAAAMTLQPQVLSVAEEIDTVLVPVRRAGYDASVECMDGTVFADRARLHQILRNLLSNAMKHGGERIVMTGSSAGDGYEMTVSDNGPGVPDEIAERLFERFVHSGAASLLNGSVGLGLAIARSLADAMGGRLEYERTYEWSRFVVWLPKGEPAARPAASIPTWALGRRSGTGR